jgi:hypothetical protein
MKPFERFWQEDRGLSALLIFLVTGLLVVPPLIAGGRTSPVLVEIVFSLILISGIAMVSARRWPAVVAAVIAAIALVVRWLRFATLPALLILDLSLTIATFLILATLVLIRVLARGEINLHRVQGAMAAYLLLGLAWGSAYELVLVLRPDAFRFAEPHHDPMTLLYYSFVTLTTVGYGDVTPLAPAARSLAIAEALIGQLFPAVLIARLVSMELASKQSRRGA